MLWILYLQHDKSICHVFTSPVNSKFKIQNLQHDTLLQLAIFTLVTKTSEPHSNNWPDVSLFIQNKDYQTCKYEENRWLRDHRNLIAIDDKVKRDLPVNIIGFVQTSTSCVKFYVSKQWYTLSLPQRSVEQFILCAAAFHKSSVLGQLPTVSILQGETASFD